MVINLDNKRGGSKIMNFLNRTVLITGGTGSLGKEFTRQLINKGANVLVVGRNIRKLEELKTEYPSISIYKADISSEEEVNELTKIVVTEHPKLSMIINNAGVMKSISLLDGSADVTAEIDINLKGTVLVTQKFINHLEKQDESAIVNITSGLGYIAFADSPLYSSSKAAVHFYTKGLRTQLKNSNIKVFEVAPPKTSSPMTASSGNKDNKMVEMDVEKVINIAIRGIEKNKLEIKPGISKILKIFGKLSM